MEFRSTFDCAKAYKPLSRAEHNNDVGRDRVYLEELCGLARCDKLPGHGPQQRQRLIIAPSAGVIGAIGS